MLEIKGDAVRKEYIKEIIQLKDQFPSVTFNIFYNSKSSESTSYAKMIERFCTACGVPLENYDVLEMSSEEVISEIKFLTESKENMIILSRPMGFDEEEDIIQLVDPKHDPDMLTRDNSARLLKGDLNYLPGTAHSVMALLEHYNFDVEGKKVLIIGRSVSVGMPIFLAMQRKGAFCSLAHSRVYKTDIKERAIDSEIIVLASGKRGLIGPEDISKDAVVIDCGYHSDGKGDLGFIPDCDAFTPVPGGVGPLTIAAVIKNGYFLYDSND